MCSSCRSDLTIEEPFSQVIIPIIWFLQSSGIYSGGNARGVNLGCGGHVNPVSVGLTKHTHGLVVMSG